MNQVLLSPNDVLFFRDGRPMEGALSGHGAAWPLPHVINAAFHAALHRSGIGDGAHAHRTGRSGQYESAERTQKFGSLVTAGPFPVVSLSENGTGTASRWFFPRPADAQKGGSIKVTLHPHPASPGSSNLPAPLTHFVANSEPPTKNKPEPWMSAEAFQAYLSLGNNPADGHTHFHNDGDLFDAEPQIGIAIDPDTGTTGQGNADGKIYSASYLRLRDSWSLGVLAEARDKIDGNPSDRRDLVSLLLEHESTLIVGGQQRSCTATLGPNGAIPLPRGASVTGKCVKWVLLSPAIWPEIEPGFAKDGGKIDPHPGGWLPNWVCSETGKVLLLDGPGREKARRLRKEPGKPIDARLVAAVTPKPIVITGWALGDQATGDPGGAKSTHLAVPAGAVYYFEAANESAASALATALNWHGAPDCQQIRNRRSTLCGEKGFGLGVCASWSPATVMSANVR